jgi:hypothetical protein
MHMIRSLQKSAHCDATHASIVAELKYLVTTCHKAQILFAERFVYLAEVALLQNRAGGFCHSSVNIYTVRCDVFIIYSRQRFHNFPFEHHKPIYSNTFSRERTGEFFSSTLYCSVTSCYQDAIMFF